VELHERSWGMNSNTGRPKLDAILKRRGRFLARRPGKEERFIITLHEDLSALKDTSRGCCSRNVETPKHKVVKTFRNGKR